ncbi:hypothetical protein ACFORG_15260 [Lutimaribacter marinistellae]|uniref:Uncharacterized protein n=1 Tax=Lutimaribacter marinistellae TaxID=1820329 RepID=A0ABV7TIV4_9RHOB
MQVRSSSWKRVQVFIRGQEAYRAGKPETFNPHPEGIIEGDDYLGPWANWRDGWRHAKAVAEFTAREG